MTGNPLYDGMTQDLPRRLDLGRRPVFSGVLNDAIHGPGAVEDVSLSVAQPAARGSAG